MDRSEILRHISDLRRRHGELEGVEAKAAHTGTPAKDHSLGKRARLHKEERGPEAA